MPTRRNAGERILKRNGAKLEAQAAFLTLPSRMQAVQTWRCLRAPLTKARTVRRLGFQRRRRVLFAWEITLPNEGPLPHNSHFAILANLLYLEIVVAPNV